MAITLNQLCAEATQRGYDVYARANALYIVKQNVPHVNQSFSLNPYSLDQEHASDCAILLAYCWVRGYRLDYGDDGKIVIRRGMLHPAFDQAVRVERIFDYHWDADSDIGKLHGVLLKWITEYERAEKE